ncbi:MAG: DUF6173 family protein [Pseudomonadota bacterium]
MEENIQTTAEAAEAAAMPKPHEVHCDPDAKAVDENDVPEGVTKTPLAQKSPARWAYERIIIYLKNFEESLDNDQEVAMGFTGGDAGVLRIEGMGYYDPDIVTFYGSDRGGAKTQLVQHVSQLNVMFRALPKATEEEEPVRIGFKLAQDLEEN